MRNQNQHNHHQARTFKINWYKWITSYLGCGFPLIQLRDFQNVLTLLTHLILGVTMKVFHTHLQSMGTLRTLITDFPMNFHWRLNSGSWVNNIYGISTWSAVTAVELRNRSDTSKANTSPQTTILPVLRWASSLFVLLSLCRCWWVTVELSRSS